MKKLKGLTFSYDDGVTQDIRLMRLKIDIMRADVRSAVISTQ